MEEGKKLSKRPYSLRDFLSPIWRYSLSDKFKDNPNVQVNQVILNAIDKQLNSVEDKTVASKLDLYLKTARAEYLDYWGSWFGLERLGPDESDNHYRQRIINHVKHPRATIPALRKAISAYLHTHTSKIHIYEPWQDVFLTNDYASRTNGRAHLFGDYYRPAIINIYIDTHFDESVVDYINWFRPVGVVFLLTYENGDSDEASIWHFPSANPVWRKTRITSYIGFDSEDRYDLNFLDPIDMYGKNPFYVSGISTSTQALFSPKYQNTGVQYTDYLPLSNLNSDDVLVDPIYFGKQYYSYLAATHFQLHTDTNDTISDLLHNSKVVNPDLYPRLNEQKGLILNITHKVPSSNLLSNTENLLGNWQYGQGTYLSGISDKGRNVVRLTQDKATLTYSPTYLESHPISKSQISASNPLKKGNTYWIGFDLRSSENDGNIEISVQVGDDQTLQFYETVTPKHWSHFDESFVYTGKPVRKISFTLHNTNEYLGDIDFSSPYLNTYKGLCNPSYQDLNYPKFDHKHEYVYAYLNVWQFYFKHVESYSSIEQKLGMSPTPQALNNYISNKFDQKYFGFSYEPLVKGKLTTRFWFMNYGQGGWINYATHAHILGYRKDTYNFRFGTLYNLINNQGMIVCALQVPTYTDNYKLKLSYLGFSFGQFHQNEASIKVYKPYPNIELWWNIKTWHIFKWTNRNTYDMRSRAQAYYPIRYIRDWIGNVSFGHVNDDRFILNDSVLNGRKLIADYQKLFSRPSYYIKPYWDYSVIPSLTDNGNPVKSISILGASCGDNYPTNRLNNLLKNSVFGYFSHPIWGHSKLVYMKKDINSEHVWFNNIGSKLWTSTDSIGARNNYVLTFNARTKKQSHNFLLKVELISNEYSQTLTKHITITPNRQVYNVQFNTFGVFPDTVRFVWEYLGEDSERFADLKHYGDTFRELKQHHYTFRYLMNHIIPQSAQAYYEKVKAVEAFKRRPDIAYMPKEPCYVYNPNGKDTLTPVPKKNKDISAGWSFNGNLPENYYPARFKHDGKICAGYVDKNDVKDNDQLSFIPDYKGDYALGYNFAGPINNWGNAFIENADTHDFVKCYGPKRFMYEVTPNEDTSEVMFRDISCHLMARVNVDGKNVSTVAPQVEFKGEDTVGYNDIVFGQPINENDLGETFGDLSRYRNTYSEFKDYGITYEDLIDHTLLADNDMTWEDLAKNNITWQEAQQQQWLWIPLVQSDRLRNWNLPKDKTTFDNLIGQGPETFRDLLHYKNSFNNFKLYHITFRDLMHHKINGNGKESADYTFDYAKKVGWLFADGEPFDHSEHCVTLDLGRVYTNIDHLLVHHGSDSLGNAVYDTCLQTSIDGKHWHTWYDNYKGDKYPLDKPYVEPKATPVAIPISKYDCFNSKRDFQENWKVPEKNYVSSHLTHYPIKDLSSLLFNDDRKRASIYLQKYSQTPHYVTRLIPTLHNMLNHNLYTKPTSANNNNIAVPDDSEINKMNNSSNLEITSYQDNNNDVSSLHYYPKVPVVIKNELSIPKVDKNNLFHQVFSNVKLQPSVHMIGSQFMPIITNKWANNDPNNIFYLNDPYSVLNGRHVLDGIPYDLTKYIHKNLPQNYSGKTHEKYKKYSHNIFYLNDPNSLLNSWYVLQDANIVPSNFDQPTHKTTKQPSHSPAGTIPTPQYSYYNYDVSLLKFNVMGLLLKSYPSLYENMEAHGINDPKTFAQSILNTCTDIYISVKGQCSNTWNISVWDNKYQSWQKTLSAPASNVLVLHLNHFANQIDKDGNIYVLVLADDYRTDDQPTMSVNMVNLKVVLDMDKVNQYHGGMYPHKNFEYNTNKLYSIKPSRKTQIIPVPWIYRTLNGHKVTVSFNLYSDTDTGKFNLRIGPLQSGMVSVEKGYQAFHFIYDISGRMKGKRRKNITPKFVIAPNNGNIKIYGLKAEIGVHLSPYAFPRNER